MTISPEAPDAPETPRKPVNLALQGGGSHGAFTWGVLDALLEDGRLDIHAITGTSAGAMNAVVCAEGFLEGGAAGARLQLEQFWTEISREGVLSPIQRSPLDKFLGSWSMHNALGLGIWEAWARLFSPYDTNPLNLNPLRDFLDKIIDFKRVREEAGIRLFIAATNVRTGLVKVFHNKDLTAQAVMASACLPQLFQAVEIDGEAYWDGGYLGNPALFPLVYDDTPDDIILIQINPDVVSELPRKPAAIADRLNEITFNATLKAELRAIAFVRKLIARGALTEDEYRDVRLHRIALADTGLILDASSKMNTEWEFLSMLRDQGRAAGQAFMARYFQAIGHENTMDIGTWDG
jgi:NTE family protein